MPIEPAELSFDAQGTPFNARYGDVYASRDGSLGQARHVFLRGAACVERWRGRSQFVIVEAGFGLGVNFLAAWQAWREDPERPRRLHFVSVERHPLPASAIRQTAPAELGDLARELSAQWPAPLAGLHRCEFDDGRVTLTVAYGDARRCVPAWRLGADAVFLDGFAPERNPEMWELPLLRAFARLARSDCRVATWTTARPVREALADAGFAVELAPGFGHKRQMLVARYAPRYAVRRHDPPVPYAGERHAVVLGAGLAGATCAHALARRDWRVTVVDSGRPAGAASSLPWGLVHPHFAVDDNRLARLTRTGAAYAESALLRVARDRRYQDRWIWRADGFFQQAADDAAERWRVALAAQQLPAEFVAWLDVAAAAQRLGVTPARAGLWWSRGAVVAPANWIAAMLEDARVSFVSGAVRGIKQHSGLWQAVDGDGRKHAEAPVVVVAAALDTPRLLGSTALPMQPIGGRVTAIRSNALRALSGGIGGDGTLLHAPDGTLLIGATYESARDPLGERLADQSNLARLDRLLGVTVDAHVTGGFSGTRCAARDRLPYAGAVADERASADRAVELRGAHLLDVPRLPGLFASAAYGSRGLTLAALAAELVAAQIEGEPLPLERELVDALDPARVLLRRLRHGDHRSSAFDIVR